MSPVPIGEEEQPTVFTENPLAPSASPSRLVSSVWLTMAFFTLYGAPDLHAYVSYDQDLARIWGGATGALRTVAEAVGVLSVRGGLHQLAEWIDTPHPVLQRPQPVTPAPESRQTAKELSVGIAPPVRRVLLVGASSIQYYLGAELEHRLENYRDVTVHRLGKLSTGLVRPDVFDWMAELRRLQRQFKPDLVIGQFGGNDTQSIALRDGSMAEFGTEPWAQAYTERIKAVVEQAATVGARTVMLGMPSMRSAVYGKKISQVNDLTREATEAAGGIYIDTWDISSTPTRQYLESITYAGETGLMRLPDGIHYSRLGARFVAERVAYRLERELHLVPESPELAEVLRFDLESAQRGGKVRCLAFVPQGLPAGEKLPVVYLLHGADGSADDWSEYAHELLQRAATSQRLVLVAFDAGAHSWYLDSERVPGAKVESFMIDELLPEIERRLPVSTVRGALGISMGGNAALALALRHPGTFRAASSLSGAVDLTQAQNRPALIERLGPFTENPEAWKAFSALQLVSARPKEARALSVRLSVGASDRWAPANRALRDALEKLGATPSYEESPGVHAWSYWLPTLLPHLSWLAETLRAEAR